MDNELLLFDRLNVIKDIDKKYDLENNAYISFSGGKDSTVLHYLIDLALPNNNIPRVFVDTGLEYDLIRKFVFKLQKTDKRIIVIRPNIPLKKMLDDYGYPFKSKDFSSKLSIYQRLGYTKSVKRVLSFDGMLAIPDKLRFMFTDEGHLKVSDKCCKIRKENPLNDWGKEHNRDFHIIALLGDEHGRRSQFQNGNHGCFVEYGNKKMFYPLRKVDSQWEEWFIKKYNIKLCDLYYAPYNFERTGCKGCPFARDLQHVLDTLERYFPNERKQCEIIWKPVYDEYSRLNYRLKKDEQLKLF